MSMMVLHLEMLFMSPGHFITVHGRHVSRVHVRYEHIGLSVKNTDIMIHGLTECLLGKGVAHVSQVLA